MALDRTQIAEFQFDVVLDGAKSQVSETDDGDLIIEGMASDYETDRDEEAFEPGAFNEGIKAYLATNPVLLYHHKKDFAVGQVTSALLNEKGLHIKARLDKPEPGTLGADIFRKVQRGTIRAFSVGGKFYRRATPQGVRIYKADIAEISVTPTPINGRALFTVGQKAFAELDEADLTTADEPDEKALDAALDKLDSIFDRVSGTVSAKVSE